ncbi:NUDIX domain-containing protein [Turneriella parva]|uniref:NUDIX hydrolase n=1 Tax=Turneriella parva (strain ATCC BAA-1111 / DSM 21527 / NCTC 11395 / H) TaxID=869212 RepID=I4B9C6_TURPD|nr:NUDIX hydrolase [Turneriella parva]AFM13883.1 NUDIX hydrolase [Turneriella parva DSM 21527]
MLKNLFGAFRTPKTHRNPVPTVDIIIEIGGKIVLIERRHEPFGWAIPGGFVDYGESLEDAARREAKEETSLDVRLKSLLGVYSKPSRDPRRHTISAVYLASAKGKPEAADDAKNLGLFSLNALPPALAFDHAEILSDYRRFRKSGKLPPLG